MEEMPDGISSKRELMPYTPSIRDEKKCRCKQRHKEVNMFIIILQGIYTYWVGKEMYYRAKEVLSED